MAVLLLVVACGGDDGFEPAPGASVDLEQLGGLIDTVAAGFDLQRDTRQPERLSDNEAGRSCFEVEVGQCSPPRAPGVVVALNGEDGARVLISLVLGIDFREAGDLVRGAVQSRGHMATETLRIIYESAPVPDTFASGPCRQNADWASEKGCAWQERGAPRVGDKAAAMKSDSLERTRLSSVVFAREFLFADVEVVTSDGNVPNKLADGIAKALDEQIKLALSQ